MRSIQRGIATSIVLVLFLIIGIAAASGFFIFSQNQEKLKAINSFDDCVKAGYPILLSYPGQCNIPDGQHFVQELSEEEKKKLVPPTSGLMVSDETANWETYKNNSLGIEFKYPEASASVVSDSENEYVSRGNMPNLRKSFLDFMHIDPPKFVGAVRMTDLNNPNKSYTGDDFALWIFDNPNQIGIDQWFKRYWYYPFTWGQAVESSISEIKPEHDIEIAGVIGKYKEIDQKGKVRYLYVSKNGKMYLFHIRPQDIGSLVLSTFKFLE